MKLFRTALFLVFTCFLTISLTGCNKNQSPRASFQASPQSGEAPLEVTLDASTSRDPDGEIVDYDWRFGDGGSGKGKRVTHNYGTSGDYEVRLTVTDDSGLTDYATETISVRQGQPKNKAPIAHFAAHPTEGEIPLQVSFDAYGSFDPDGKISDYDWDFKDGETGKGLTVTHTYYASGSYDVQLTVTDDGGATATSHVLISVSLSGDEDDQLEIIYWELKEDSFGDARIEGEVRNNSSQNRQVDCELRAKFYNADGARIGNSSSYIFDISPGDRAEFEIVSDAEFDQVDRVELKVKKLW